MLKGHKVAIARIFADLIKADRIVDTGEMECWRNICNKYAIDKDVRIEAREVSFADALNVICNSGIRGLKEDLLGDCRSMTVSDGFCTHSEALLMIALSTMLESEQPFRGEVISIPIGSFNIDIATALYIENEYDPETNEAIKAHYRSIFKEFQLVGFHFVYIPKIIDHYRNTDSVLFKDILSFLAPSMSETGLDNTYKSLMKMTTGVFCKDLLCNKCGITELRNTMPSLLIKIGNSFVGEAQYANYLKIDVDEDIATTVQTFVDCFSEMLNSDVFVVNTSEERDNQFHFHGFYKQLLDIFLVRRNIRSSILLNPYKEEIIFPNIDSKAMGLHRRERALYALLLCQGSDGINFSAPKSADALERYNRRMKRIQQRYSAIYEMFGGEKKTAPDLSIPEIRRPIFSCLKRSLKNLQALYNPEDYNITKSGDGAFSVNVEPELVYVCQLNSDEPVPLHESEMYRKWSKI
ncbi:hypothetical protein [Duncaniella muris]|uniref:hypothetical protein n=1 Tax=Duncaniella muris TaxID=2094150 RepID=UPI00272B2DB0|nr:hypothetical protein [Duncaniella muris]